MFTTRCLNSILSQVKCGTFARVFWEYLYQSHFARYRSHSDSRCQRYESENNIHLRSVSVYQFLNDFEHHSEIAQSWWMMYSNVFHRCSQVSLLFPPQTFRTNRQTMIVPQRPPQAPAATKQTSSALKQTAALVSRWWRCLAHQRTLRQQGRRERLLYRLRTVGRQLILFDISD